MNSVHCAVELYATVRSKLSRQMPSVFKLDDDVAADIEGPLEQRPQFRAAAADLHAPDLGLD